MTAATLSQPSAVQTSVKQSLRLGAGLRSCDRAHYRVGRRWRPIKPSYSVTAGAGIWAGFHYRFLDPHRPSHGPPNWTS